ncbi:MAG: MFS transporter [Porticoccaceae bacterium]|nr:MFS transporter [Porticoccaceae bacterium]
MTTVQQKEPTSYRFFVLLMLFIVYTFNYLDRQIISILAVPIQQELDLSDTQLGLMGGFAFALFYSALGVPIARFADRLNRSWIIAGSLTLWSSFTALCGLATGFWQLFLARLGVGVGEAGGVAPSFSMISDYFPQSQRARALAAFTLALPVGTAAGLYIGGQLAVEYGWRTAFLVLGLAGVIIAPFFLLIVREPERGRYDPKRLVTDTGQASFKDVCKVVLPKASFWYLSLGSGVASMLSYGLAFWLPAYVQRSLELDLSDTSKFLASAALIGGTMGIILGGLLGDYLGKKDRGAYGRIPAVAFMIAMPFMLGAMATSNLWLVFFLLLVPQAMGLVWAPPSVAAIQQIAPAHMRATASAIYLLITNLIGLGAGTVLFGVISDILTAQYGGEALRYSIVICCLTLYPAVIILYLLAARNLKRDEQLDETSAYAQATT